MYTGCVQILESHGIRFTSWKVMQCHGKVNQMVAAYLTRVHVFGLHVHYHCPLSDSVQSVI